VQEFQDVHQNVQAFGDLLDSLMQVLLQALRVLVGRRQKWLASSLQALRMLLQTLQVLVSREEPAVYFSSS
jgi:hypothetical protein